MVNRKHYFQWFYPFITGAIEEVKNKVADFKERSDIASNKSQAFIAYQEYERFCSMGEMMSAFKKYQAYQRLLGIKYNVGNLVGDVLSSNFREAPTFQWPYYLPLSLNCLTKVLEKETREQGMTLTQWALKNTKDRPLNIGEDPKNSSFIVNARGLSGNLMFPESLCSALNVKVLSLSKTGLSDKALSSLVKGLETNATVEYLDLSENKFTHTRHLGSLLQNNKTLKTLILRACFTDGSSGHSLSMPTDMAPFWEGLQANKALRELDLSFNVLSEINHLDLFNSPFGGLKKLSIHNCYFFEKGKERLIRSCLKKGTALSLTKGSTVREFGGVDISVNNYMDYSVLRILNRVGTEMPLSSLLSSVTDIMKTEETLTLTHEAKLILLHLCGNNEILAKLVEWWKFGGNM